MYSAMFPNQGGDIVLEINNLSQRQDYLPPQDVACPKIVLIRNQVYQSHKYRHFLDLYSRLRVKLEYVTGDSRIGDENIWDYYIDILAARKCHSLPSVCHVHNETQCITDEDLRELLRAGDEKIRLLFRDGGIVKSQFRRLNAAPFLLNLKRNILLTLQNQPDIGNRRLVDTEHPMVMGVDMEGVNWWHYSAHDTSIAAVIGDLEASDMRFHHYLIFGVGGRLILRM